VIVSVQMPYMPIRPEQAVPFAALVLQTEACRLWMGEARYLEQHQVFAFLAGLGVRIPAGFAVDVMPLRHPFSAAIATNSVAAITGQPVAMAIGPGATMVQGNLAGAPYRSQIGAVEEYLRILRPLVSGRPADQSGEFFSFHGELPPRSAHIPEPELGLGVLRPRMAELAGSLADFAVTYLTPKAYLEEQIVPALARGAEGAGRLQPRVVALVPCTVARPGRDPVALAYSPHLQLPHYVGMLAKAGLPVDLGEAHVNARAAIEGRAHLSGGVDEIVEGLLDFGLVTDEVVVSVAGVCQAFGPRAALADLQEILAVLAARRQGRP
jgi:5,10-methylenetetrahydromethanopterin reductase